jgi:DNA uptake protein ComE-like DNA-binding protein
VLRVARGGFALITVLWLIVALSAAATLSLATARVGHMATANRMTLARGRWAAEACFAVTSARWAEHRLADTATVDLGQGKTCSWRIEDPAERINVNTAEREILENLAAGGTAATGADLSAILERRRDVPFQSVEELRRLGIDSSLVALFTVDGPGVVNLNAAPAGVLAALPGMTSETVSRLVYRRDTGRPFESLDELVADLSPPAREALVKRYADLLRIAVLRPPQLLLTLRGWVAPEGGPEGLHATIEVLAVPLPERLAVIRRRMW